MNRSRIIRRAAALAAGSLVATAAMLAVAAPASAHHTILSGECQLDNGKYVVVWTVQNNEAKMDAKITKLEASPDGTNFSGFEVGTPLPAGGKLTGKQTIIDGQEKAVLVVAADWGDNGEWNNKNNTKTVNIDEKCRSGQQPPASPSVPAEPSPSATPSPEPEPTLPPLPGEPEVDIVFTCEEIQFTLKNPKDSVDFELIFTPSKGAKVTKNFPAGETTTVKFPATKGFKVVVSSKDWEGETVEIPFEQPEDCDGEGGGLPVTGTAVGGIAAGAAVLLAIGAGLFVMSRRRRIRFTA